MSFHEQGSPEWFAARLGKASASRIYDIMPGPRGYRATRDKYLYELLAERLTGERVAIFQSDAMKWGVAAEGLARNVYEALSGNPVDEVGFIDHPRLHDFGASPDGLIGDDGGLEIKCPGTQEHLRVRLGGDIKEQYIVQMQVGMMCTERKWWDYVSYDPRLPETAAYFNKLIPADEEMQADIMMEVVKFLKELDAMEEKLK